MRSCKNKTTLIQALFRAWVLVFVLSGFGLASAAQQPARGTIRGTVTADQGQVIGFRVAAHNLDRQLWYTVFTNQGHFTVPQALPGRYEVMVFEPSYDSPKSPLQLGAGESRTIDLAIRKRESVTEGGNSRETKPNSGKIEYVNRIEDMFPPGPGLDNLKKNCTGCHFETFNGFGAMHFTKERFLESIEMMTETGPGYNRFVLALGRTPMSREQKSAPGGLPRQELRSGYGGKATPRRSSGGGRGIALEVDLRFLRYSRGPSDYSPGRQGGRGHGGRRDRTSARPSNFTICRPPTSRPLTAASGSARTPISLLRLDSKNLDPVARWKNYPIKGPDPFVQPSGIAIDKKGRVYWAELKTGLVGEFDPATGKQIRHALPEQAGAIEEVVVDKDDNVDFGLIWGSLFGRMDAVTRKIHMYPTPTPDNGIYGLAVDQHGNMWGGGWQKGDIIKWDADTELVKEYPVPNSWGEVRRIGVDSKAWYGPRNIPAGISSAWTATGEISEYKIPVSGAKPYEAWADKQDNVWSSDQVHSTMIKLDRKTRKFAFYPMPQPNQSVPKIQVADDNTIWFGTRNLPITTAVHFYPNGYTAEAPPLP